MMRQDRFTEGAQQILTASQCRMKEETERRAELQHYRDQILPLLLEGEENA